MAAPFNPRRSRNRRRHDDLAEDITRILRGDPEVTRLTKRLAGAQRRLRKLCSLEVWQAYLVVESETNARADRIAEILLQRGFTVTKCHELKL